MDSYDDGWVVAGESDDDSLRAVSSTLWNNNNDRATIIIDFRSKDVCFIMHLSFFAVAVKLSGDKVGKRQGRYVIQIKCETDLSVPFCILSYDYQVIR